MSCTLDEGRIVQNSASGGSRVVAATCHHLRNYTVLRHRHRFSPAQTISYPGLLLSNHRLAVCYHSYIDNNHVNTIHRTRAAVDLPGYHLW